MADLSVFLSRGGSELAADVVAYMQSVYVRSAWLANEKLLYAACTTRCMVVVHNTGKRGARLELHSLVGE